MPITPWNPDQTSGASGSGISSVNGKSGPGAISITKNDLSLGNVDNTSDANKPVSTLQQAAINLVTSQTDTKLLNYILASKAGAASGVATLDAAGTLSTAQIPASLLAGLKWKGVWNASTNSPTLSSTPSANGEFYRVSVAGTSSVPTGSSVTYGVGDWLISNGTSWQVVVNTLNDATTSTKGVVQLAGDLAGGAASPSVAKINSVTVPATGPGAARKFMMSASTTALQYDSITSADLPTATGAANGAITLAGDLAGTAALPAVKKIDGWSIGNSPTNVNQVLACTDYANKVLGYVTQSGGGGVAASYYYAVSNASQTWASSSYILFQLVDAISGSDISYSSGVFTLKAGKTYKLSAYCRAGTCDFMWYNITSASNFDGYGTSGACAHTTVFTPSVDTQVAVKMAGGSGTVYSGQAFASIEVISGSSAVTGQSVNYMYANSSTSQAYSNNSDITFSSFNGNITRSGNTFNLLAGVTYELSAGVRQITSGSAFDYTWYNNTTGAAIGNFGSANSNSAMGDVTAEAIITPASDMNVSVKMTGSGGSGTAGSRFATIRQLGTSSVTPIIGATSTTDGVQGTAPAPVAGQQRAYLKGDATWDNMAWQSYTPTITGSITNPTLATTKTLIARYRVVGKSLEIAVTYYSATGAGAAIGSGAYMFSLPPGFTIDTSVCPIVTPTSAIGDLCGLTASTLGSGLAGASASAIPCVVVGSSATTVSLFGAYDSAGATMNTLLGSSGFSLTGTGKYYKFTAAIPIL